MLRRGITTIELIQLNKMFSSGRGYKDLIRDFKQSFNVELPKPLAKQFLKNRSWEEVLHWLTGDRVNTKDLDHIPELKRQHFELLEHMLRFNAEDEAERERDLATFEASDYYVPDFVKYFNFPLYGEIITYFYKDPFLKCFLFDSTTHKITKIEDVYISDELPKFLLTIVRKINTSPIGTDLRRMDMINDARYMSLKTLTQCESENRTNIFDSELFRKYNITYKT